MTPPIAELRGVSKSYGRGATYVRALEEIGLSIRAGELTFIEGPSGSGKTTLLQILGLLQKSDEGEVWLDGRRMDELHESRLPDERRRNVVFIFQGFNLLEALTVADNVAVANLLRGGPMRSDDVQGYLKHVGLDDRRAHLPAQISGGEKQRTAIARALACPGRLVLADEPTANLDWASAQQVVQSLADLAHEGGRAVVLVSHDSRLEAYADRIVRVLNGRISKEERVREPIMSDVAQPAPPTNPPAAWRRRTLWGIVALAAVIVLGRMAFQKLWQPGPADGRTGSTAAPAVSGVNPKVTPYVAAAPAVAEPASQLIAIRAERLGRIRAITKGAGERIKAGEPLVLLDDSTAQSLVEQRRSDLTAAEADFAKLKAWRRAEERGQAQAAVDRAQARLDRATRERGRVEDLHTHGSASDTEFDQVVEEQRLAKASLDEARHALHLSEAGPTAEDTAVAQAKVDQARSALKSAESQLALCTIVSPLDGHVIYRHLEPGEVVEPQFSGPILSVGNLDKVRLRAEVDEADILRVKVGQRVEATAEAFGDRKFFGRIVHLEPIMGAKKIRTGRTTERRDVQVREVLIELDVGGPQLPIGLQMTARFLGEAAPESRTSDQ